LAISMPSTTSREQLFKRANELLANCFEQSSTLTPTNSEQHAGSSEQHSSIRASKQTRSQGNGGETSGTDTCCKNRSSRKKASARRKRRNFQRAKEILAASDFLATTADPIKSKKEHSSVSHDTDPNKSDEPESRIVSI